MAASRKRTRRRSDRISGLTDDVLGHVLSFLPTKEAARAAALARRWHHVFGSVHTISFEEQEGEREADWYTYYYEAEERKSCSNALLDGINAALLCRRRCPRQAVPLRSLRFTFDSWDPWDKVAVDQWLSYAIPPPQRRHTELHLDLRFRLDPICGPDADHRRGRDIDSDSDHDEDGTSWRYLLPRRLFSCAAIRTLCLSYCRLKLPGVPIDLPFLETLRPTGLHDSERSIQRLISSCPRLADLTMEALSRLTRVSVVDKRICRFALRCCHNIKSVDIDVSELRSLDYKGFPLFSSLMRLTLQGCIERYDAVAVVRRILEQTPNLETLTLLMEEPKEESGDQDDDPGDVVPHDIIVPDGSIPCLRHGLREIAMEGYEGSKAEKMMAKLLLCHTLVLERLHVVFREGLRSKEKNRLEVQMKKWGVANSKKIFTSR